MLFNIFFFFFHVYDVLSYASRRHRYPFLHYDVIYVQLELLSGSLPLVVLHRF
jgi:hypothetical protein